MSVPLSVPPDDDDDYLQGAITRLALRGELLVLDSRDGFIARDLEGAGL